jgi:flagellar biosynthesis GTPase FlhF
MADEGRIRVQLEALSAQDTETAKMLADTVKQIGSMFDWLRSPDFKDSVNKLTQLSEQMKRDTQRFVDEGKATQTRGYGAGGRSSSGGTMDAVRDVAAASGDPQARQDRLKEELAENQRQRRAEKARLDQESKAEQDRAKAEQDKLRENARRSMTDEQRAADRQRQQLNIPAFGTQEGDSPDAWWNAPGGPLSGAEINPMTGERSGGFRIPRFGQLNPQDYLNMLRDSALDRARKAATTEGLSPEERATQIDEAGQSYARWQKTSNRVGNIYALRQGLHWASNFAQRQGLDPMQFADMGGGLGYDRQSNNLLGLVQTPFNAAGGEGWRQFRDTQRMRWMSGINLQQAQAITEASAQAGFGGGTGSDLRMNFLAPAFRRWGVDPQALTPMTQVLRTGTGSIQDLNTAISGLGDTARSAHLTVNETAESLNKAGEAAQAMGGSYLRGMQFGGTFMRATGLPSNVGDQLSQNPIVQAYTSARTGLPAMAQGALDPVSRMRGQRDALNSMVNAFLPGAIGHTEEVTDKQGHTYTETTTKRDVAIGMAAQQLGLNVDQAKSMMSREGRANEVMVALAATDEYARGKGEEETISPISPANRNAQSNPRVRNARIQRETAEIKRNRGSSRNDLRNLQRLAKDAGVDPADIQEASDAKGRRAQANAFRDAINNKVAQDNAEYQIAFTGEAERYFKALAKGKKLPVPGPRNTNAGTSTGPNPTGGPQAP